MARTLLALVWALLITAIVAAPTRQSIRKRSFKVHRVRNQHAVRDARAELRKAYLKFGLGDIALRPGGEAASIFSAASGGTGTEDGETPTQGANNEAEFISPVSVGGQTLLMNFDTGSSDMWVFNTNLAQASQQGHTIYDPSKSNASLTSNLAFSVTYGDSSFAKGPVGFDTVDIGGATVDRQAIGLPNNVDTSFVRDRASNGLVGLAFSKLNTIRPRQQKTFFENVRTDLSQPVFTAALKAGTVGSYEFGRIDPTAFAGEMAQVPVDNSRGFWEFDSATFEVNGQKGTVANGRAIADTGTSLMLVMPEMAEGYWSQVPSADNSTGMFVFDCDQAPNLPDLKVACGDDYVATVEGVHMNFAPISESQCVGGLQAIEGGDFAIYGDTFFKSQFVAFQAPLVGSPSLGMAPHA